MRHLRFAAGSLALLVAACGNPVQETNAASSGATTGQSGTTARSTTGQSTIAGNGSTSEGTSAGNGSTSDGTNGQGTNGSNCSTTSCVADSQCCPGSYCSSGICMAEDTQTGTSGTTGESNIGTTGTSGTTVCSCNVDSDCNDQNHTGLVCVDGACQLDLGGGEAVGSTGGGCANQGGTTGQGSSVGTSGTTGTVCACSVDSDCNDANHMGFVCASGTCQLGNEGAVGTSGGGCANPGNSTGTSGTTGTVGNGGPGCPCATNVDCESPYYENLVCIGGLCGFGSDAAATSTGGRSCNSGDASSTNAGGGNGGGGASSTPLVLDFDGKAVHFTRAAGQFELGQGASNQTDWVSAATPWLALDRDGNGRIDSGEELFGSLTVLSNGKRAKNGFEALAALDENHDGVIDAKDPAFAKLVLWRDANQDRRSSPEELTTLAKAGVVSIELGYATSERCDARQNCEIERANFRFRDMNGGVKTGAVIDVHLRNRAAELSVR